MRPAIAFAPVLALTALAGWGTPAAAQVAGFVHTVTAANQACTGNRCTRLIGSSWYPDHGEVRLLATSNWNPPGSGGVYYAEAFSLQYFVSGGGTVLRTLFGPPGAIPPGAAFNVLAVRQASCVYSHFANASNVSGNVTFLDRPGLNGNPLASMHVLASGGGDPIPVGVYYDSDVGRWGIFNEDLTPMSTAAVFTILDNNACTAAASGLSQGFLITCLSPSDNHCGLAAAGGADPGAKLLVTQLWSEDAPVYNPHPIGVFFNGSEWRVFNQDLAAMPSGARFLVSVINVMLRDDFEAGDLAAWAGGSVP